MKAVLVMFKDDERRDFALTEPKTILGRRQDAHLRIPTNDVSRQHCAILMERDKLVAKDLGSSNGTFVNGKRIAESELKAGDRLRVGPVVFLVQIDGKPAQIKPEDLAPPQGAPAGVGVEGGDAETFDLSDADFDLDDPISALEDLDDEKDMP